MKFAKFILIVIVCAASAMSAGAQKFQEVGPVSLGATILTAGSKTFWAYVPDPSYSVYEYSPSLQSMQRKFVYGVIKSMSSGGGSAVQNDEDWLLDPSGYLWRFDVPTQALQLINTDSRMQDVVVGPGYLDSCHPYEVWVTFYDATQGRFAARYNFCTKALTSVGTSISMSGPSKISTGGGEVWALNTANQVFRYNSASNSFVRIPGSLIEIAVGVDGVWGVNAAANVFEFNPVTQTFVQIPGSLTTISAGGDGVWGVSSQLQAFRYEASTRTFLPIVSAPPLNDEITVGTGGGVWSKDTSGNLTGFVAP